MSDQGFPLIEYKSSDTYNLWGRSHGEEFRDGIKELCAIRKELMIQKNPKIAKFIPALALEQFHACEKYNSPLTEELVGIADGSNCTIEEIIILNNYTDFRDIEMPEEGCSTVHIQRLNHVISGQTWDMHSSAKKYVCAIKTPETKDHSEGLFFSLVGCLGMMGINSHKCLLGVNNINTQNARSGILWPMLVRRALWEKDVAGMENILMTSPVTSGHNYIISDQHSGAHLEVTPVEKEEVLRVNKGEQGEIFHTNHCLGEKIIPLEDKNSISSTTHVRYSLLEEKVGSIESFEDFEALLKDHEGHPKSICSHFESGAQDPSMTCGGGAADFKENKIVLWRGCEKYDENYAEYRFKFEGNSIIRES